MFVQDEIIVERPGLPEWKEFGGADIPCDVISSWASSAGLALPNNSVKKERVLWLAKAKCKRLLQGFFIQIYEEHCRLFEDPVIRCADVFGLYLKLEFSGMVIGPAADNAFNNMDATRLETCVKSMIWALSAPRGIDIRISQGAIRALGFVLEFLGKREFNLIAQRRSLAAAVPFRGASFNETLKKEEVDEFSR